MNIQEVLNQVLEYLRGAWRFRWLAGAVAAVVCLLGWAIVLRLPDLYGASARVFVDTQTMLSEVTRGLTLDSDVDTQINRVRQMMLSAPQLLKVGEETGLFASTLAPGEKQRRIDELQQQIVVEGTGTGGSGSVYLIAYQNPDRDLALRIVDNLLKAFVDGTRSGKRSGTEKAQEFLSTQIKDYEKSLSDSETRLADFKKRYVGLMPGSQGDYFTRLQNAITDMQKVEGELTLAKEERTTLQKQLNGQQSSIATEQPAVVRAAVANSATTQRLHEAQVRLDESLLKYTDKHPEVVALRETIKDLEKRQAEELTAAGQGNSGAATISGRAPNPVYAQIQQDFNQNDVRISKLQADISNRRDEVARLKGLVNIAPDVEAQLSQLNRNYQVTQDQYHVFLQRMESTRLSEAAEEKGSVLFEIMVPPTVSFYPVAPKRPPLIIAVLVFALVAGGGLAFLMHLLKPVYSTPAGLESVTGLPVIGVVPRTWLDLHRRAFRHSVLKYAGAVGCLALMAVLVVLQESVLTRFAQGILR